MSEVTATNAYKFLDNYRIEKASTAQTIGVEHNQQEAEAIACYLTNHTGVKHVAIKNGIEQVRKAKEIRGNAEAPRVKYREDILAEMLGG